MKTISVKIGDEKSEWVESFTVEKEDDVNKILENFNDNLRPYETKRRIVEIIQEREKSEIYGWDEILYDGKKFITYVQRQAANAYGTRSVKDAAPKILAAWDRFLDGKYSTFCKLVRQHGSSAYDDMSLLGALTKKQYEEALKQYKEK